MNASSFRGSARFRATSAFAGLLLTATAAAQDSERGWFLEAGTYIVDSDRDSRGFVIEDQRSGWSLGGGYRLNSFVSVVGSYQNLGDRHFATDCPPPLLCIVTNEDRVDIDAVALAVQGRLPITGYLDVFAKVGVQSWGMDFRVFPEDRSGEDVFVGAGLGWSLTPHWRLSAQYERSGFDVDSRALSIQYGFGH